MCIRDSGAEHGRAAEEQVGRLQGDQAEHVVGEVELDGAAAGADAREVELGAALVEEVLAVPAVVEHPRLSDPLEAGLLLRRQKAERFAKARQVERVVRGMNPDRGKGGATGHVEPLSQVYR